MGNEITAAQIAEMRREAEGRADHTMVATCRLADCFDASDADSLALQATRLPVLSPARVACGWARSYFVTPDAARKECASRYPAYMATP